MIVVFNDPSNLAYKAFRFVVQTVNPDHIQEYISAQQLEEIVAGNPKIKMAVNCRHVVWPSEQLRMTKNGWCVLNIIRESATKYSDMITREGVEMPVSASNVLDKSRIDLAISLVYSLNRNTLIL